MWTIIKFDRKKLSFLKKDFKQKLGDNFKIYIPKFFFHNYKNNKLVKELIYSVIIYFVIMIIFLIAKI